MNSKTELNLSLWRTGRLVVVALLFAWGTYALWHVVSIDPFDLPGPLRAIFAIGPVLALLAAYALIRKFRLARHLIYGLLVVKLLEAGLAIVLAPPLWPAALLSVAIASGVAFFVHRYSRAGDAGAPRMRRGMGEAGLFAAYLGVIALCLVSMDLIRGPQPMRNLTSPIATSS